MPCASVVRIAIGVRARDRPSRWQRTCVAVIDLEHDATCIAPPKPTEIITWTSASVVNTSIARTASRRRRAARSGDSAAGGADAASDQPEVVHDRGRLAARARRRLVRRMEARGAAYRLARVGQRERGPAAADQRRHAVRLAPDHGVRGVRQRLAVRIRGGVRDPSRRRDAATRTRFARHRGGHDCRRACGAPSDACSAVATRRIVASRRCRVDGASTPPRGASTRAPVSAAQTC